MAKPKFIYKMASYLPHGASLVAQTVKNLPASVGDIRDMGSNPELGGSSRGEHGNPLQLP